MIFGVDTSRYQTLGSYDRQGFEIVNVEDPQFGAKVAACIAAGVPWGAYLWVYPGHDLGADTAGAVATVRGLGHGEPPLGLWFDYEQNGVQPGELAQAFAAADAAGMTSGYYSGPSMLDHGPFLNRRWWNAAYPGANDGSYPGVDALWASSKPRPMTLWQFTSGGGIDRNVVIDEAWFATAGGATPVPVPIPVLPRKAQEMFMARIVTDGASTVELWSENGIRLGHWAEPKDGPLTKQYRDQLIPVLDYPNSASFAPVRDALVALKHAGKTLT